MPLRKLMKLVNGSSIILYVNSSGKDEFEIKGDPDDILEEAEAYMDDTWNNP